MFLNDTPHSMTANGRVSLPRRFQKELSRDDAGNLCGVLTFGFEGCLFVFSEQGFKQTYAKQNTNVFVTPEVRRRQRLFFSRSHQFTLDGSGRLIVPERFREVAGLKDEVVMVGAGDRAEIWDPVRWAAENHIDGDFDALGAGLDPEAGPSEEADA